MVLVDDRFLYVALEGDNKVVVIDTITNAVSGIITVGAGRRVWGLSGSLSGRRRHHGGRSAM
jgi:YVTN family beta-propeller protein